MRHTIITQKDIVIVLKQMDWIKLYCQKDSVWGLPHLDSIPQLFCWNPGGILGPNIAYVWRYWNLPASPYNTWYLFQGLHFFLLSPVVISYPELQNSHFAVELYTPFQTKGLPSPWPKLPTCFISGPVPSTCDNYCEVGRGWTWIA